MEAERLFRPFQAEQGKSPRFGFIAKGMEDAAQINRRAEVIGLQFGGAAIQVGGLRNAAVCQAVPGIIEVRVIGISMAFSKAAVASLDLPSWDAAMP